MRKFANLLNDSDPAEFGKDLDAISRSRQARAKERDINTYLDFLEESAEAFGFAKRKKEPFGMTGKAPLLE